MPQHFIVPSEITAQVVSLPDEIVLGIVESNTIALFAPREPPVPGEARVRLALLPESFLMVPELRIRELVALYHDNDAALTAEKEFDALFIQKDEPDDIPEYRLTESEKLIGIMVKNGMVASNGEGKRMITQGGVRIDKEKVDDIHSTIEPGKNVVLKVGKRKFLRIIK